MLEAWPQFVLLGSGRTFNRWHLVGLGSLGHALEEECRTSTFSSLSLSWL